MRRVPKDKKTGLPKKYLSGIQGRDRAELARVIKQISALYRAGKRVPKRLMDRRIALGKARR
tara:strand:+ start:362 stop:547 length:186 start_codon:yes stop_codon:yes gene_type:complete